MFLPTWVGDAVMATPTLRTVRLAFPRAHLACVGGRAAREVLAGVPFVDEFIEDTSKAGGLSGLARTARRLREGRFDACLLLSNSFRAALVCRIGKAGRLIGYSRDNRGPLLHERVRPAREPSGGYTPVPAIEYYLALARRLGCDPADRTMHLAVEPPFARQAEELFLQAGIDPARPVVLINPGASFGSSKLYPPERLAQVADELAERHGAQTIVNASPDERPIAAAVVSHMRRPPAISFAERGNSLGLLKALTARSSLMITGDTGPRHIAAALGIGVVTLFGSTDPRWTTIDCPRERIVRVQVECSPCQRKTCPLPPGPQYHQCMLAITPEMVLSAAEELLPKEGGP